MKNEETEEAKKIINKYPKQAIKGDKLELNADWKKAMVSFLAIARVNVDISKKQLGLTNQISESFDNALKAESPIELNEPNRRELQITFRIKNLLLASGDVIKPEVIRLDKYIVDNKEVIYHDLFLYYVAAKAGLLGELEEARKIAGEIDITLARCFKKSLEQGVNLEEIEKETLSTVNTREDIKEIIKKIYNSVEIGEWIWQ